MESTVVSHLEKLHEILNLDYNGGPMPNTISNLSLPNSEQWNNEKINQIFGSNSLQIIKQILIIYNDSDGILVWKMAASGKCTSKEDYKYLTSLHQNDIPQTGSRAISNFSLQILKATWKEKIIPPKLKTFAWRVLRQASAIGCIVGTFIQHISKTCSLCGMEEDDAHLFFKCTFQERFGLQVLCS